MARTVKRASERSAADAAGEASSHAAPRDGAAIERRLRDALEQQAATSEILRVISRSPGNVEPVFETIVAAAHRLCDASQANVFSFDGELLHVGASLNDNPAYEALLRSSFPRPPGRATGATRSVQEAKVVLIPDVLADTEYAIAAQSIAGGFRSVLAVPLLKDGTVLGTIAVGKTQPGPFPEAQVSLLQTFADQAVIAIENARLFAALETRNRELATSLDQQTATSEILRVISRSPTDVQPVFDTIAEHALRLCSGVFSGVFRYDGELIHAGAFRNTSPEVAKVMNTAYPSRPARNGTTQRAVLTGEIVHMPDVREDPEYGYREVADAAGFRSVVSVPMLQAGKPVGAITVYRDIVDPFPDDAIRLLKTFADQAAIAIENVRMFAELERRNRQLTEALAHQTATSDILGAISGSPTDVQPVFDIICERAVTLCDAQIGVVSRVDGETIHLGAIHGAAKVGVDSIRRYFPMQLSAETVTARTIRGRAVVNMADALADPTYDPKDAALTAPWRSCLAVPMLRGDDVIGAIFVARTLVGEFDGSKVALLKTFADQAVIAIQNVRMFTEVDRRNRQLTEALAHQTATSDILGAISGSPTDVTPVFEIICERAVRLCDAQVGVVSRLDGQTIHLGAVHGAAQASLDTIRSYFPMPISTESATARSMRGRTVVHLTDALADPTYGMRDAALAAPWRSCLAVPMLRGDDVIGAIFVSRVEPGEFAASKIALLKTFADQAVIAVENVRLFNELAARSAALARSVGELRALGEVGQAVSATLDVDTLLDTIVDRTTALTGMDGAIYEYDAARKQFDLRAADRLPGELVDALRATPMTFGEGALGRMAMTGEPVEVQDVSDESAYQSRVREVLLRLGYRSLLVVPLIRENQLLGGIAVNRKRPGAFDADTVALLQTFASQSALALQNARLYREVEQKGRELAAASRHKSEFLANMSHELRTPLNAIIGFSEVLVERMFGELNAKQAEYVDDILVSGRHLLALINDILDLSKIEAGRMELDVSDVDVAATVGAALTLVRERAQRKDIALACELPGDIGVVPADERKVKQVLLNLLSNALKFTPRGGRIAVRVSADDGHCRIAVSDTGVGIAPEDQAAVFEEFRQVGAATKKAEGTGLGLAISRKYVELHGGTLVVSSEPGRGATFTMTLPRQRAQ
jgi:GAF domain-containing protein/anti-sigma regulatory factor (Ser/Thr protein kinase)